MTLPSGATLQNRLLATLPQEAFDHLKSHLEPVSLLPRQVLYEQSAPIDRVYFPEQGVLSVLAVLYSNWRHAAVSELQIMFYMTGLMTAFSGLHYLVRGLRQWTS